jgi:hypothetical protein
LKIISALASTLPLAGLAILTLFTPSVSHASELIQNGDFSSGFADWDTTNAAYGSDYGTSFNNGQSYAYFGGVSVGSYDTVAQTVSTVAGQTYDVSFELSNEYSTSNADFQALWDGNLIQDFPGASAYGYTGFSFDVVGTGSDTLSFEGYQVPSYYLLTDVSVQDVSASPTPEPSSLLLLASGFAGMAGVVRRRLLA